MCRPDGRGYDSGRRTVPKITAVFCDVGGVLLTNGLDHLERAKLAAKFSLDARDFEDRVQRVGTAFDADELNMDEFLDRTVFYTPRAFDKQQVREFIYMLSEPFPDSLAVIGRLARASKVFLATLNNESRELNTYRIEKFGLRNYFSTFFSSCFLRECKPHPRIYQMALDVSQRQPQDCVFIDDRPLNLESPRQLGMHTIQFLNAGQLESDLRGLGLK